MSRWIELPDGLYSEDVIAFVRKLRKKTVGAVMADGSRLPGGKEYVLQLKDRYALDARGKVRTIFLTEEQALPIIELLKSREEKLEGS